ncbi:MAG TPA: protoporphyrinogen oxidase [Myxococcota bacterium]|nr:protoporphyrinogen oxidase [Myxococcota bacterium]
MGTPEVEAVVVGAGIAGLAAALELQSAGCDVHVADPSDRPGGVMRTDHRKGFVVESGPSTALVRAPMLDFLSKRGLDGGLLRASPANRKRFLYRGGQMIRVPDSAWRIARTPLLSTRAKLRALAEPFHRRSRSDESVAEFIGRRFGKEVSSALVGPFLTGVYAGDEDQLGAAAVFPRWVDREQRFGSLALGGLAGLVRRDRERGLRGSYATEQGFGPFARRLAEGLAEPPALGTRVAWIARDGARWRVDLTSPSGDLSLSAARVVVAAPAYAAADLLRGLDGDMAAALEGIAYAPIVVAPVGIEAGRTRVPIEGFGFIVPREESLGLLGCLFMSQLFPRRAPPGHELLHCMLGGVRWPESVHLPDSALEARLAEDLSRTLGVADPPAPLGFVRWARAVPQPGRDHRARIRWLFDRQDRLPGLALAGAYVAGVSVSDSLASGVAAAARVLAAVPFARSAS